MLILNIESLAHAIKEAEGRMADRRRGMESRADHVRDYLLKNMLACQVFSIECEHFKLSVRDSRSMNARD